MLHGEIFESLLTSTEAVYKTSIHKIAQKMLYCINKFLGQVGRML